MPRKALALAIAVGLGWAGFSAAAAAATTPSAAPPAATVPATTAAQLAQLKAQLAALQAKVAELEQRTDAQSDINIGTQQNLQALQSPAKPADADAASTKVGGNAFIDFTHIDQTRGGSKTAASGNGLDVKRFYLSIDHTFNDIWSANLTTDFNYVSADGETQLFVKKAYLQGTFDKLATLRVGSAGMPWIGFVEDWYGYRFVEPTLVDRNKFGNVAEALARIRRTMKSSEPCLPTVTAGETLTTMRRTLAGRNPLPDPSNQPPVETMRPSRTHRMSYNVAQVVTGTLYRNIFNRDSDSAGFQYYVNCFTKGRKTLNRAICEFFTSNEFVDKFAANQTPDQLSRRLLAGFIGSGRFTDPDVKLIRTTLIKHGIGQTVDTLMNDARFLELHGVMGVPRY